MSLAAWGRKCALTIDHTKVTSDQSNFPVLVGYNCVGSETNLPSEILDSNSANKAQSNGEDIRFTSDSDGNNALHYEIVVFTQNATDSSRKAEIWVKTNISSSTDTVIYVWYKNGSASAPSASDSDWGSQGVWDNCKGVYHLKEDPSGTDPQLKDSTSNGNSATSHGSQTSADQVTGKIDGGLRFDGSNDYLTISSPSLTTAFTISAHIKTTSYTKQEVVSLQSDSVVLRAHDDSSKGPSITLKIGGGYYSFYISALTTNTWYRLTATYTSGTYRLYLDGVEQKTGSASGTLDSGATNNIGIHQNGSANPFSGVMDELEILNVERSADWLTIEQANQTAPSTFMSVGTPESMAVSYLPRLTLLGVG